MTKRRSMIAAYAVAHLLVDFSCALLLFGALSVSPRWDVCLLVYNFCAFALQMPLGLLADAWNKNALIAGVGCALVAAACVLSGALPLDFAVVLSALAGVGNGLFHIGGGIDVLNASDGAAGPLGVFVAPGALGVFAGTLLGRQGGLPVLLVCALLLAFALWFALGKGGISKGSTSDNAPLSIRLVSGNSPLARERAVLALLCLFLVVCLRSYAGMTLSFPWKGQGLYGPLLVLAVALGKAAGGFLADRFGALTTSVVSLLLCATLFLFPLAPAAGIGALLLFNMTMPVTLWAMARLLRGAKGFSFGLLTFALFLGFLPSGLGAAPPQAPGAGYALVAIASMALLMLALLAHSPRRAR